MLCFLGTKKGGIKAEAWLNATWCATNRLLLLACPERKDTVLTMVAGRNPQQQTNRNAERSKKIGRAHV